MKDVVGMPIEGAIFQVTICNMIGVTIYLLDQRNGHYQGIIDSTQLGVVWKMFKITLTTQKKGFSPDQTTLRLATQLLKNNEITAAESAFLDGRELALKKPNRSMVWK